MTIHHEQLPTAGFLAGGFFAPRSRELSETAKASAQQFGALLPLAHLQMLDALRVAISWMVDGVLPHATDEVAFTTDDRSRIVTLIADHGGEQARDVLCAELAQAVLRPIDLEGARLFLSMTTDLMAARRVLAVSPVNAEKSRDAFADARLELAVRLGSGDDSPS